MTRREWQELIELFWWDRYGRGPRLNERTRAEIEELARRVSQAHDREMKAQEQELTPL